MTRTRLIALQRDCHFRAIPLSIKLYFPEIHGELTTPVLDFADNNFIATSRIDIDVRRLKHSIRLE